MSALLAGDGVERLLLAGVALIAGILLLLLLRRTPRLAVALWLASLCLAPIWAGVSVAGTYLPPATLMALVVIVAALPVSGFRVSPLDLVVVLTTVGGIAGVVVGGGAGVAVPALVTFLTYGLGGYLLGRLVVHRVGLAHLHAAIAVAFTGVAVLAVVEFALTWNPFVLIPGSGSLRTAWAPLQIRGGVVRAEGAFGHSIALGCSLAVAIPLTLAARFALPVRLAMTTALLLGTVVSFSRVGMLTALLGLVLSIVFLRDAISFRVRAAVSAGVVVVVAAVAPFVQTVFEDAGTEATNSSDYRGDLYTLIPGMRILGPAASAHRLTDGRVFYGDFRSIDSQLVLTGLTSGLLVAGAALVALAVGIWLVLRGRATAATIALVSQIPALASVALITQYATLVWFLAGVAATSQILRRDTAVAPPPPDPVGAAADSENHPEPALPPLPERTPTR